MRNRLIQEKISDNYKHYSFFCYLIIVAIYVTSFTEGFDIGPVSGKVYIALFLLFSLLVYYSFGKPLFFSSTVKKIVLTYALFIAWRLFARVVAGQSFLDVFEVFLKRDLVALIIFFAISVFVKNQSDLILLVNALILNLVISTLFGIAQFFNIQIAWDIQRIINPTEHEVTLTLVPGLYYMPFTYGYYIAALFPLALSLFIKQWNNFTSIIKTIVVLIGMIILQQRSAILASIVTFIVFMYFIKIKKNIKLCIISIFIVGFGIIMFTISSNPDGMYVLSRMSRNVADDPRNKLMDAAIEYIKANLVFGISQEYLEIAEKTETKLAPHNIVLNILLTTGIPGLFIAIIISIHLYLFGKKIFVSSVNANKPLGMGLVLALCGFFINSIFHNSNFFMGDFLAWWIFGLMAAYQKLENGKFVCCKKTE